MVIIMLRPHFVNKGLIRHLAASHQQSIVTSSAERRPSEWNTGTMCKDRRFYRHLWIRYIRVRNKIMYVLSWHISRYFTGWGHDMPNVVIGRASGQWQIGRFLMMTSWYGNALSGEMMGSPLYSHYKWQVIHIFCDLFGVRLSNLLT